MILRRPAAVPAAFLLLLSGGAKPATAAPSPAAIRALPVCTSAQISPGTDSENGNFNGMSHSGTLLVLRNLGPEPCRLPGLPTLTFLDAAGHPLPIARGAPPGMRPGPVILPVGLAVGAEATAPLRWVSAPVYTHNRCLHVAALRAAWPGGSATHRVRFTICGRRADQAGITQPPLRTDPALPAATGPESP